MTVADRIGVMNDGRLVQVALPAADLRAAVLPLGRGLHRRRDSDRGSGGRRCGRVDPVSGTDGRARCASPASTAVAPGDTVWIALRPEKVRIAPEAAVCRRGELRCVARSRTSAISAISPSTRCACRRASIMKAAVANVTRIGRALARARRRRVAELGRRMPALFWTLIYGRRRHGRRSEDERSRDAARFVLVPVSLAGACSFWRRF